MAGTCAELAGLRAELDACASGKRARTESVRRFLTLLSERSERDSARAAAHGLALLSSASARSAMAEEERLLVYEQVAIAAADSGDVTGAEQCVKHLERAFPGSIRAGRLRGMVLEASGDLAAAREKYATFAPPLRILTYLAHS